MVVNVSSKWQFVNKINSCHNVGLIYKSVAYTSVATTDRNETFIQNHLESRFDFH